ncbi:MAG TPA: carboxypeptidase-like regulatory domain-containing protein [Terriglobia bacterium]|nr:carboxypeptidase-like regulatory domain-containing protein [Terriglobia bacterium]
MKQLFRMALLLIPALLPAQSQPGSISGRVVTATREPAVGVRVAAMTAPQAGQADSTVAALVSLTQTDADGRYRLEDVPSGAYLVMAGGLDAPTYYPDVFTVEKARIVRVSAGGTATGIDLQIPPSVNGRLQSPRPDRTRFQSVTLDSVNDGVRLRTLTTGDGSFRFTSVPPGTYSVSVEGRPLAQPMTLNVKDQDVTGLEVELLDIAFVKTILQVDGGGLLPRMTLTYVLLEERLCQWLPGRERSETCTVSESIESGGRFLVEGNYQVVPGALPAGYFLKSIVSGNTDLAAHPLRTKGGAPPIVITLGVDSPPPWVRVSGRVRNAPAAAIARPGKVTLLPDPGSGEPSPLANFIVSTLDAEIGSDGAFEFPMVPAGIYRASLGKIPIATAALVVADRDLNSVDIVIPPLKEIAGRFGVPGPSNKSPELTFQLQNSTLAESLSVTARVECGRFRALFPQGSFSLTVTASGWGYSIKSVTYGGTDVLQNPLTIGPNDQQELEVLSTPGSDGGEFERVCFPSFKLPVPPPILPLPSLPEATPPPVIGSR